MAFTTIKGLPEGKFQGEAFIPGEDTQRESGGQTEKITGIGTSIIKGEAEKNGDAELIAPQRVGPLAATEERAEEALPGSEKKKIPALNIQKIKTVSFSAGGPLSASPKGTPAQSGSDRSDSPKSQPIPRNSAAEASSSSRSSASSPHVPAKEKKPYKIEIVHSSAQRALSPKGSDESLSRRDSPKEKAPLSSASGSSPEEKRKRSLSSEGRVKRNLTSSIPVSTGKEAKQISEEEKEVVEQDSHVIFSSSPEERRKRSLSSEPKVPRNLTGPLIRPAHSEPQEPVSLRSLVGKTVKQAESVPVLKLEDVRGKSFEDLRAKKIERSHEAKERAKLLSRTASASELKRSEMVYSYREPVSPESQRKESPSAKGGWRRKYLPDSLFHPEVDLQGVPEIKKGKKAFDSRLVNLLKMSLEKMRQSEKLSEVSYKALEVLFKKFCAQENSLWFMHKKKELSNPQRFLLSESPRSHQLVSKLQKSGALLVPILERLHLMKDEVGTYIKFQGKRSPWTSEFYRVLCSLTAIERLKPNAEALEYGINLKTFLDTLNRVMEESSKKNIRSFIASAFGETEEEQTKVIAFLSSWVDPAMEIISGLEREIRDFDWLMMKKGMIPHIKHVCYEVKDAPFSIGTIEVGEMLRCLKQSDETPVLLNSMTINGEPFYDSSRMSLKEKPELILRALNDEAPKNSFLRRILRSLLFHIIYTSVPLECEERKKELAAHYKKYFGRKEDEAFLTLASLWLERSESAENKLMTFLKAKGLSEVEEFSHASFWKSFEGFLLDMGHSEFFEQLTYLLATASWIRKEEGRFEKMHVPFGKTGKLFKLVKDLNSMKNFYCELFLAFHRASKVEREMSLIESDVDFLIEIGKKKNSETAGQLKERPLPFLNVLRLTSNSCWGFADQVIRSLYPALFSNPYMTKLKQGIDCHVEMGENGRYEVALVKRYAVYRRTRADSLVYEGQDELAEIPFYWKVSPYEDTWKGVLKILKSFVIHPAASGIDQQNILSQLINYNRQNETNFAIASNLNEEKRFSYTFTEPIKVEEDSLSS